MAAATHRQVVLAARPDGIPQADHFAVVAAPTRAPEAGEVLVRAEYWVDPAMRAGSPRRPIAEPVPIGVMRARGGAGGRVALSRLRPRRPRAGDARLDRDGHRERRHRPAGSRRRPAVVARARVLGLTGATAWFGITEIARPRVGDTVVVSTAAGAVGSVAGQLAHLAGCRTVGIAGSAEKVRLCLDEFGYDAAVDYRSPTFGADLAAACPAGVDVYYDNTGGAISDAVLRLINRRARIVVCGTASVPSWDPWPSGPMLTRHLLTKSARMEGFLYFDFEHRLDEALAHLTPLVRDGRLRHREDVLEGVDAAPDAIAASTAARTSASA
jgi:hypothetical protein